MLMARSIQSATITPANSTDKSVTWSVHSQSGNNIVTVSVTGQVTAVNPGTAVIRVTSNADPTKYAECNVTVASLITDLTATPGNDKVDLTFTAPTGASSVILMQKAGIESYTQATSVSLNASSTGATVTGLSNGTTYTFKLVVVGGSFAGSSNEVTVIPVVEGCFIATAAYGSEFQPAVVMLRHFRDEYLLTNKLGRAFVNFYYHNSPPIANYIAGSEGLKGLTRILLMPFIAVVYSIYYPLMAVLGLIFIFLAVLLRKKRLTTISNMPSFLGVTSLRHKKEQHNNLQDA